MHSITVPGDDFSCLLSVTGAKVIQKDNEQNRQRSFLSSPRQSTRLSQAWTTSLVFILILALLLRCFTATFGYSGYQKPPTYGDFEAQRHWMEITTQLPITQWYFHDPHWWRLDYPPLTAYHSWLIGEIGTSINPSWFAFYDSRGLQNLGLKIFMRVSVILSEWTIFIPAMLICVHKLGNSRSAEISRTQSRLAVAAVVLQPALILIDHGHFQYNGVMLGFFMATLASFLSDWDLVGCAFFVAALGFKQMALFYAPAVAAYLAGSCLVPKFRPVRLLKLGVATISSFAALYAPILIAALRHSLFENSTYLKPIDEVRAMLQTGLHESFHQVAQALHRIFPFSRGLFEDKVANIWCFIQYSGIYKLTLHHSPDALSKAALALTLLAILPPCLIIFLRPRKDLVLQAFTTCAWGFFLCSYQVHEKNVLLPLVPMTTLLASPGGDKASTRAWVAFANIVATWTLFHLLIKDDLQAVYFPLLGVWLYIQDLPPFTLGPYRLSSAEGGLSLFTKLVHLSTYGAIAIWHVLQCFVPPPSGKPDLWIVINIIIGCGAFCLCYLWCLSNLFIQVGFEVGIFSRAYPLR